MTKTMMPMISQNYSKDKTTWTQRMKMKKNQWTPTTSKKTTASLMKEKKRTTTATTKKKISMSDYRKKNRMPMSLS